MAALKFTSSIVPTSVSTYRNLVAANEREGRRCLKGSTNCGRIELAKRISRGGGGVRFAGSRSSWLCRPVSVRAAVSEQMQEADNNVRRESLKKKLIEQILATAGNLDEECIATIKELEKENPNPESLNTPELHAGYWERLKAAHLGTGRTGEAKVEVGYEGASATLGRATFGMFKPSDLDIVMGEVFNYVPNVGSEGQGKYAIYIEFTTKNPKGDDLPPIEGLIINAATPQIENPSKMGLLFDETSLRPSQPERDIEAWREIFEEASGGAVNELGEITVINEKPATGFLDVRYIDSELRITKGNLGSYVVVRRMDKPPSFIK
ncbi:hypothetical protein R1flu_010572 [Riccia fluitans]|uniref:Plastid lipid-associated protein/fibrillin conserved domain-containing protein n=1 Tax=Riccia fluitans TaxID=41844 RepID=A0ABD1Z5I8_9MARC